MVSRLNQSMSDVIIQGCGSMEAAFQFCVDNGVSLSDVPVPGTVYVVSPAALALGDAGVLTWLAKNSVVVATLGGPLPDTLLNDDGDILLNDDGRALEG